MCVYKPWLDHPFISIEHPGAPLYTVKFIMKIPQSSNNIIYLTEHNLLNFHSKIVTEYITYKLSDEIMAADSQTHEDNIFFYSVYLSVDASMLMHMNAIQSTTLIIDVKLNPIAI